MLGCARLGHGLGAFPLGSFIAAAWPDFAGSFRAAFL